LSVVKIAGRQNPRAGPGSFHAGFALLADNDARSIACQEICRRQPDDAAADHNDIAALLHTNVIFSAGAYDDSNHPEDSTMSGVKLLTKHDPKLCLKAAFRAAQNLGFNVTPIDDNSKRFSATKGNFLLSALAGPFAPRCDFQVSVETYLDTTEVVLDINKPWLSSGSVGVRKVKEQADALLRDIISAIEKDGGKIAERREF
jgi:hypothetical protein